MQDLIVETVKPQNLLFYLFAYGLAATPTSYLVARILHRVDIKERPGHSHTASYFWSAISKKSAILIFGLDLLKGLVPCAIAHSLEAPNEIIALVGFFAVLGHCFSPWLWFMGGHGGTTMAGSMLFLCWPASVVILAANFILIHLNVVVGNASIVASILGAFTLFFAIANKVVWSIVLATVGLIVIRHHTSIR